MQTQFHFRYSKKAKQNLSTLTQEEENNVKGPLVFFPLLFSTTSNYQRKEINKNIFKSFHYLI
jgi:hypothetical protein